MENYLNMFLDVDENNKSEINPTTKVYNLLLVGREIAKTNQNVRGKKVLISPNSYLQTFKMISTLCTSAWMLQWTQTNHL